MSKVKERLIVALDVDSIEQVEDLVTLLGPHVGMFKVGLQLYTSLGPQVINIIQNKGGKIFADLKLHDIPNTVAQASRVLTAYGVQMFNVHAAGGSKMMAAAAEAAAGEAARRGLAQPLVIAVTVLTSLSREDLQEVGLRETPLDVVTKWSLLTKQAGLDGVVASPQETSLIRNACGPEFITVTPGVRPRGADLSDQKRVMTPKEAIKNGSSYLVVGRPITAAADPLQAVRAILAEMEEGLC